MRARYGAAAVLADVEALLDMKGIGAVVIATPAATHFRLAERALKAGRHVFVEKPLALTVAEGSQLIAMAREAGRILFTGHILQYHAAVVKMKEMIRRGVIGRLQYLYSRRLSLGKIRREENILWSFAPHDISLILGLVGEDPHYIDSTGSNFLHPRIPDVTMTNLKFPSGVAGHIFVSWLNPFKEQRLIVVGSEGMIVFDDTQPVARKLIHYPHVITWKEGMPVPERAEGLWLDLSAAWVEPLKAECAAFLAAVRTGEAPLTDGEEGLRVLKVLEASQRSLEAKDDLRPIRGKPLPARDDGVFVHETAVLDDDVDIGQGTKIWCFSHVLSGSRIGEHCNIGQNVVIGPDVRIGHRCKIQNNVSVYKGVTLEDGVFCGPSMVFTNIFNPRAELSKMDQVRPTRVRRGATFGANCTIVCGVTIGEYAFVGAGAVVTKDVPDHALMVGNPARQTGWVCRCGEKIGAGNCCPVCGLRCRAMVDGSGSCEKR
jgi:UDP-2-acetamido-3-amino-2,3-dideoxy-glucuronate N-acetyltransferase